MGSDASYFFDLHFRGPNLNNHFMGDEKSSVRQIPH